MWVSSIPRKFPRFEEENQVSQSMASTKTRGTHLPMDVLTEIIHRLPVKSILRFKTVCKSWYDVIQNPIFISKHLHRSIKAATDDGVSPFLFLRETSDSRLRVLSLLREDTLSVAVDFKIPSSIKAKISGFWDIVGSCNGLLVVSDSEAFGSGIILWNPATRKFRRLPASLISSNPDGMVREGVTFGFGSHPEAPMEYKLLRIVYFRGGPNQQELEAHAEIYSQSTESWRLIDAAIPCAYSEEYRCYSPYIFRTSRSEADFDGVLHWTACVDEGCAQETIIAFDMRTESFRQIPIPSSNTIATHHFISLVVFEGCLGVVIIPLEYDGSETYFDVWVMKEYGNPNSWTKQFVIGPFLDPPLKLVGCWRNGEIIIQKDLNELLLYEPNTRLTRRIPISGVSCSCTYKESLVPVRRRGAT